jgi:translation initiation factor 1A
MTRRNFIKQEAPRKTDEFQEYGIISKVLGGYHYDVKTIDGISFQGRLSGKLRQYTRVKNGDLVLLSLRDFQKDKCDIIFVYDDDDVKKLYKEGSIPTYLCCNKIIETEDDKDLHDDDEDTIIFEDL